MNEASPSGISLTFSQFMQIAELLYERTESKLLERMAFGIHEGSEIKSLFATETTSGTEMSPPEKNTCILTFWFPEFIHLTLSNFLICISEFIAESSAVEKCGPRCSPSVVSSTFFRAKSAAFFPVFFTTAVIFIISSLSEKPDFIASNFTRRRTSSGTT